MPIVSLLSLLALTQAQVAPPAPTPVEAANAIARWLPGREADARVAAIAYRLATAGIARCPLPAPAAGIVLEHLGQFEIADRPHLALTQALDRGPEVVVVVRSAPADTADIWPGDVVLATDGAAIPDDAEANRPFDATRARVRSDRLADLVTGSAGVPHTVTLLRRGERITVRLDARPACPSRVHLARSDQRNAYADGRHVFLTTGLLALLSGDDQLAFVIAHEMAHNILGHAALQRAGASVRVEERDADRLGGELMLDAGYDPIVGVQALTKLGGLDLGIRLFASHDSTPARIAAMRQLVAARRAR